MRFETSSASRRFPTLNKSRIKQFSLATLDQGASSFTSLALQIALVSILGPKEFGSYAVAASIQGLAYLALYALLLEPMSVIGPQQAEEGRYLVRTFAALLLASLVAGALLVVTAGVCGLFD